ncbi:hypothetical protein [Acetivibrio cellulolyticus]|uniref:hypothetical protein n=1 Tax=Acetivibrio cellulolyticus TaxID=35830 RepID=UPI0001E2C1BD|nr:hypothetical protein [Acetivibrio cellulolyticus]
MAGFAKVILISILVVTLFVVFTNFVLFFPWYMTLAYETYNLASVAANYNYLPQGEKEFILDNLKSKPVFKENPEKIVISSDHEGEYSYDYYKELDSSLKPYGQRGESFYVEIRAAYPFKIQLAGSERQLDYDVSFRLPVTGIRYYKDLE